MNTKINELAKFARQVIVMKKEDVDKFGVGSVSKFFERKHSFLELGTIKPLTGKVSKEDFMRYVKVDQKDCHFVTKRYNWDSEGNLVATLQLFNPIKSETVAKAAQKEEFPFKFVPRYIRKRNEDGGYRFDIITFDVCWE